MRRLPLYLALALAVGCDDEAPVTPPSDASLPDAADAMGPDPDADVPDAGPLDAAPPVPDARPPLVPDELPTEGEADLEGASALEPAVTEGLARAGRVDDEVERLTGPEAKCRVGDYRLDNARISVCIQAETTFSQMSSAGGNIVDAHRADRPGTDALRELNPAPGLGSVTVDQIGIVRDGGEGGDAIIRVEGNAVGARLIQNVLPGTFVPPPFRIVTEYRLSPDADSVQILSWIYGLDDARGALDWMDLVYFGDSTRLIQPGPPANSLETPMPWVAAEASRVSYGWISDAGPFLILTVPALDLPGVPAKLATPVIRSGDVVLHRRRVVVGTGDVESVRPLPEGATVVTLVGANGARLDVTDADGVPVTRVKLSSQGMGAVSLLPGTYTVTAFEYGGGEFTQAVEVGADPLTVELALPEPGRLQIRITEGDDQPTAARVLLSGAAQRRLFVVDEMAVELPPGMYRAVVTRGWHYSVVDVEVAVVAGEEAELVAALTELIPTQGWTGGEFHQHSSPSLDSQVAIETRILSNLAEGVGFMVPSDHDVMEDFGPFVRRMGLDHRISVPLTGMEVSPLFTHIGAYGVNYDPYANAGGAPALSAPVDGFWTSKTVPALFAEVRAAGARFLQINHPRQRAGYFNHAGYAPDLDIGSLDPDLFSPDFNSVEVYNNRSDFCEVLTDWMGLLNQGLHITGVGNSDTHSADKPPGYPRNYLPTATADPAAVTADEIADAVTNGVVTVGAGAMIDFPEGPQPGDTVTAADGTARIHVRVRTPDYANVNRLVAFANGVAVVDQALEGDVEAIVDFDAEVEVPIGDGAHVIFLALGGDSLEHVRPGSPVFAFSNPIWYDRDGGGVTPVGPGALTLPEMSICN